MDVEQEIRTLNKKGYDFVEEARADFRKLKFGHNYIFLRQHRT